MGNEKRVGPLSTVTLTCTGCIHHSTEYYCVEDGNDVDSGFHHFCGYFGERRHLGNYASDRTPAWCPFVAPAPDAKEGG